MTTTQTKTVYVVAWEYDGGGGFDWYPSEADARARFEHEKLNLKPSEAYFLFPYVTEVGEDADETTAAIDCDLIECCAKAATRAVGAEVLAYWQANGFKMGDATNPA